MADILASDAHNSPVQSTARVPLITPAKCQLHTKQGTITRSYRRTLHNLFTEQHTRRHICQRLDITTTTMSSIAWTEFHRAFRYLPTGIQRIIRRWMYGYLPTQRRLARYKISPSDLCPICNRCVETDLHFLTCGGSPSWNESLFNRLEHLCHKHNVHTSFHHKLVSDLRQYLDSNTPPASLQSDIGWYATFSGLFAQHWIQWANTLHHTSNGSFLITQIINIILLAFSDRWKDRCHQLHQTQHKMPEHRTRLEHQVRALYTCKDNTLKQDRGIFSVPLPNLLQQSTATLKLFLSQYTPIIKQSIRLHQAQLQRQHRDIGTYFIRIGTQRGSL